MNCPCREQRARHNCEQPRTFLRILLTFFEAPNVLILVVSRGHGHDSLQFFFSFFDDIQPILRFSDGILPDDLRILRNSWPLSVISTTSMNWDRSKGFFFGIRWDSKQLKMTSMSCFETLWSIWDRSKGFFGIRMDDSNGFRSLLRFFEVLVEDMLIDDTFDTCRFSDIPYDSSRV